MPVTLRVTHKKNIHTFRKKVTMGVAPLIIISHQIQLEDGDHIGRTIRSSERHIHFGLARFAHGLASPSGKGGCIECRIRSGIDRSVDASTQEASKDSERKNERSHNAVERSI